MRVKSFVPMSVSGLVAVAVAAVALLFSIGCKKSNNSSPGSGTVNAMVNDTLFTPPPGGVYSTYTASSGQFAIDAFELHGNDTLYLFVTIYRPFTLNQPIDSNSSISNIVYYNSLHQPYSNVTGMGNTTITVTSFDSVNHKIAGTFSGNLYSDNGNTDSIIVKNGTFNSSYLVQ
jgi:hypothetical protein